MTRDQLALQLRWSLRDLRARWPQVLAIALVIALGTGSYAGLSSITEWRRSSTNDAYASLELHDLRVRLSGGALVPMGQLSAAAATIPSAAGITAMQERLAADVQVDASAGGQTILVPGRLYGAPTGGPMLDTLAIMAGAAPTAPSPASPAVLLEHNFARHYGLPPAGTIRLGGGAVVPYTGQALSPEHLLVTTERGGILAEANFANVFTTLDVAQTLVGAEGRVNELVVGLHPGADAARIKRELEDALAARLPGAATVTLRADESSVRINLGDIEGDQEMYGIFAILIFAGAVVAAFNLVARVVDAQRREIGVAMVLGVPPVRIAIRPLLLAAEVAVLGVVFGVLVGLAIGAAMRPLLEGILPLPHWDTAFRPALFARAAAAGFVLPFLATLWPVWRAVHMPPVAAIRSGYRVVRGAGLAPLLGRLRLPTHSFVRLPFRNVVRAPRRALLAGLGVAAAVAVYIGFAGLIDSFAITVARGESLAGPRSAGRLEVELDTFRPVSGPLAARIRALPELARAEPGLRFNARLQAGGRQLDIRLDLLDLQSDLWRPRLTAGQLDPAAPGLYLSQLAAHDLGVTVGDSVVLRHVRYAPDGSATAAETTLPVLGLHAHPFRFVAYMPPAGAGLFGLAGTANVFRVQPAPGVTRAEASRALFAVPGVTSTTGVHDTADALRDILGEFSGILRVVEVAVLLLALLIAFNAASINADERSRESATMFAFGVPVRLVLAMAVAESTIIGVFATVGGLGAGWLVLTFIVEGIVPTTFPDIDIAPALSAGTVALAATLGIAAVAAAPLLTLPRLRAMDVPATLKTAE